MEGLGYITIFSLTTKNEPRPTISILHYMSPVSPVFHTEVTVKQQYHVVLMPIGLVGRDLGLGRRASWAVHGIGAWVHVSLVYWP